MRSPRLQFPPGQSPADYLPERPWQIIPCGEACRARFTPSDHPRFPGAVIEEKHAFTCWGNPAYRAQFKPQSIVQPLSAELDYSRRS